jgi:MFS family permease
MSTAAAQPSLPTGAAKWTVVGTLLLAAFVYTLNTKGTVLQTEQIIQAFHLDRYRVQWITGAEGIMGLVAIFAPLYFVKVHGVRRLFLAGAGCLALGSLGTMLARTPWQLGVAGVVRSCAALYAIPGLLLMMQLLPRRKALCYCSYLAMVYGGQVLAEPFGSLVEYHPSWRVLFVVIEACAWWFLLCAAFLFPRDRPTAGPATSFDWIGVPLFAAFLGLVFFLLYRGNYLGWLVNAWIGVAFGALAVVTVLFVWRELVAPEPFIDLTALTYRTVATTSLAAAFWSASLYGTAIQLPQYLLLRGYEHWKTGLVLLPAGLVLLATMVLGAFHRERARYVWTLRLGLAGMSALGFVLARVDLYTSWQWLTAVTSAWALCAGICLPIIGRLTYEGQLPEQAAATGALKFFLRAFGSTVGVLLAGILLDRAATWGLEYVRASITLGQGALQVTEPAMRDHMVRHGSTPAEAAAQTDALLGHWVNLHAEVIGYRTALRFCAWASAIATVISFFIHRRKEFSTFDSDV